MFMSMQAKPQRIKKHLFTTCGNQLKLKVKNAQEISSQCAGSILRKQCSSNKTNLLLKNRKDRACGMG
jgi:hypothetical protein